MVAHWRRIETDVVVGPGMHPALRHTTRERPRLRIRLRPRLREQTCNPRPTAVPVPVVPVPVRVYLNPAGNRSLERGRRKRGKRIGERGIRTPVGRSQQIYSLPPLATRAPHQMSGLKREPPVTPRVQGQNPCPSFESWQSQVRIEATPSCKSWQSQVCIEATPSCKSWQSQVCIGALLSAGAAPLPVMQILAKPSLHRS